MAAVALFFDTSALTRRYDVTEPGAEAVRTLCSSRTVRIGLSRLARLELHSALTRKVQMGFLTERRAATLHMAFERHLLTQYVEIAVSDTVLLLAGMLITRHYPLRAADAVHVASALEHLDGQSGAPILFVTADRRQARAAGAEGLTVEFID